MAHQITRRIPSELNDTRLDRALAALLTVSRAEARELIERGATVDGELARPSTRVRAGAVVVSGAPEAHRGLEPEAVEFGVLYEDSHVIVVDKPASLTVHPGSGQERGTLAAGLFHRYPEIEGVGAADRWGLVHRLDKDTSGALLVARTQQAYGSLSGQIRDREVERTYLGLVDGVPTSPTGTIEAPLGRDPENPRRRAVVAGGKPARTHFEIERTYRDEGCALVRLRLETGRTHQIRVHLAAIGHPIVGDPTYGKTTAVCSPRTFLHAVSVEFTHPAEKSRMTVESPLPDDLRDVLEQLSDGQ